MKTGDAPKCYSAGRTPSQATNSDDALFAAVLALPPRRRWRHFDRLVGRREVSEIGFNVSERRLSPPPNAQRDATMASLHDDGGLTYPEIARAYHITPAACARACQRFRRRQKGDNESLSPSCLPYDQ